MLVNNVVDRATPPASRFIFGFALFYAQYATTHKQQNMEDDDGVSARQLRRIVVSSEVVAAFSQHSEHLRSRKRERASELQLRSHLEADQSVTVVRHDAGDSERLVDEDRFGVWQPGDRFQGDVCLRTLYDLLLKIDREGCRLRRVLNAYSIYC
jgi:hypothetical protein